MTCFSPDLDKNIRLKILYLPMVTKAAPIVRVIVKNPPLSVRSIVMTFLVRECYGSPKKQEF
jgi:hypothetical protein